MLEVHGLSVAYSTANGLVRAVSGITFSVPRGTALGLWGHSGCGKSTIMRALLGLPMDEPGWIAGEAMFDHQPVSPKVRDYVRENGAGVRKNVVGFTRRHQQLLRNVRGKLWRAIMQEPIYSFELKRTMGTQIEQAIAHLARQARNSATGLLDQYCDIVGELDLPYNSFRHKYNLTMSGGECQRAALALNLIGSPQLLFADEPTTAMDILTRFKANKLIRDRVAKNGLSLLVASHNREELAALVDHVYIMCRGVGVESFPTSALDKASTEQFHPYTRELWFAHHETGTVEGVDDSADSHLMTRGCPYAAKCSFARRDDKLRRHCEGEPLPIFDLGDGHRVSCWLFSTTGTAVIDPNPSIGPQ